MYVVTRLKHDHYKIYQIGYFEWYLSQINNLIEIDIGLMKNSLY